MDEVDKKLLIALEEDARVSLKNLAKELDVKTSTIYHRLHKLKESDILEQFTIVINPGAIGITHFAFVNLKLKSLIIGDLDSMFLESFSKFLTETFECIVFSAVGSDGLIHTIASFQGEEKMNQFKKNLLDNPYVESIDVVTFDQPTKGKKIFTFPENIVLEEEKGEIFDSGDEGDLDDEEDDEVLKFAY